MSEPTLRWVVHGYRWCPHYKNVYEWDESQVNGCLWCSERGADDDHPRLGVLTVATSAILTGEHVDLSPFPIEESGSAVTVWLAPGQDLIRDSETGAYHVVEDEATPTEASAGSATPTGDDDV